MHDQFRRGDHVEVRSPAEILATLDGRGTVEGLPFMPEMIALCGRRFTVDRRADKVCDTVNYSGSRRVPDTVLLADVRCDGSDHEGCQAECLMFWKEAWLRKVDSAAPRSAPPFPGEDVAALRERVVPQTRFTILENGKQGTRHRCQNTAIPDCSQLVSVWDPRAYIHEYTSGNVTLGHFLRVTTRAAVTEPMHKLGLVPEIHLPGTAGEKDEFEPLNLQPGELVRVKPKEAIARTLTRAGRSRGMWFDREMFPYCGNVYRVRQRIARFIDERSGKLVVMKKQAVTLDGVVCSGDYSICRWLCPRAVIPYWREEWLERVEPASRPATSAVQGATAAVGV